MTYMKAICCRIKTYIECSLAVVDQVSDLLFIGYLCEQPSLLQFFIYSHIGTSLFSLPAVFTGTVDSAVNASDVIF
jgi:hypothetical protein